MHIPGQTDRGFHGKPIMDSTPCRSGFQSKPIVFARLPSGLSPTVAWARMASSSGRWTSFNLPALTCCNAPVRPGSWKQGQPWLARRRANQGNWETRETGETRDTRDTQETEAWTKALYLQDFHGDFSLAQKKNPHLYAKQSRFS